MNRSLDDTLCEQVGAIVRSARDGLDLLRGDLPSEQMKIQAVVHSVRDALLSVEQLLTSWTQAVQTRERPVANVMQCDLLSQTESVRRTLEELCEQHGVRVAIAAGASLPPVVGMPERIAFVLLTVCEYVVRMAMRDSVVQITLSEVAIHHGSGVSVRVSAQTAAFSERDRYHLFEALGVGAARTTDPRFERLAACRQVLDSMQGELWVERDDAGEMTMVLMFPAVRPMAVTAAPVRCKLDVVLCNAAALAVQCRHGALRSHLQSLEQLVRQVVRHPRDTVMLFEPRGLVSVMMQGSPDAAKAVIARIRHAIAAQGLATIGPESVEYDFRVASLP